MFQERQHLLQQLAATFFGAFQKHVVRALVNVKPGGARWPRSMY
jgi:hypothetical protein